MIRIDSVVFPFRSRLAGDAMDLNFRKPLYNDRRIKPRMDCDYEGLFQGLDDLGSKYSETGKVVNLSAGGIYAMTKRYIETGSEVRVRVALPTGSLEWGTSKLDIKGRVVRTEPRLDGVVGIAIRFEAYKFV